MAARNNEPPSQAAAVDGHGNPPPPPAAQMPDPAASRAGNKVFKSGSLFISSKGIGWTSWKKRWFILTRTSLVFFRSDPNAVPQRGSEVNLTLGGIDLNNSGSVVVKTDKKLLTVLFPDGRDGRAFTLKAETMDDLHEWKNALEAALTQAPSPTLVMGQNSIFRNDQAGGAVDGSMEQLLKDKQNMKSVVVGRPILLALEEVDGTPSFLEKALRFIEDHGAKVEGILRQAADVDDVEHRIREYEHGKIEFSPEEDAHVIGDCIKYVIRELPSSPVPASCCNALLEACRTDRERRVTAMRAAICETFPEPNRRLLQRILIMMQKVAAQKAVNRMIPSAVAACMAPLLLRPLLAGDCELEHDFDVGGDGSAQLLQAAAAANHAQSIVITLLEEYDHIFGEGSLSPDIYSDSEESGSEGEEVTEDESYEDDDEYDEEETDYETENVSGESRSESGDDEGGTVHTKELGYYGSSTTSDPKSPEVIDDLKVAPVSENDKSNTIDNQIRDPNPQDPNNKSAELVQNSAARNIMQKSITIASGTDLISDKQKLSSGHHHPPSSIMSKLTTIASGTLNSGRRQIWGRTPAKKNVSMESIGDVFEEDEIQKLEDAKADLESKIAEEAKENEVLLADLECQKKALVERRQSLEKDVAKLQAQLQKERDLRRALEAALKEPHKATPYAASIDRKVKVDLEKLAAAELDIQDLKKKVDDLGNQLNKQREENSATASQQTGTKPAKSQPPNRQLDSVRSKKHQQPRRQFDSLGSNKHQPPSQQVDPAGSSSNKQEHPSQQQ